VRAVDPLKIRCSRTPILAAHPLDGLGDRAFLVRTAGGQHLGSHLAYRERLQPLPRRKVIDGCQDFISAAQRRASASAESNDGSGDGREAVRMGRRYLHFRLLCWSPSRAVLGR